MDSLDIHSDERGHSFFVEWRVTDPSLISGMSSLQEELKKTEPNLQILQSCAANNMHVTMNQLILRDDEQVNKAIEEVKNFEKEYKMKREEKKEVLHLSGFGNFKKRVLFVKVKGEGEGNALEDVYNDLQTRLQNAGLNPKKGDFNAHLTVCKAPRGKNQTIPEKVFDKIRDLGEQVEGEQPFNELVFCVKRTQKEQTPPVLYTISL
uniref:A-kinase anchor protein 7-like phosphoesterase domain-containing protein n=1 Tax=Paramoeba aestuarina TaxID=180227 RepID=A0A7S4JRM6_9EUKA|eukprot:CAMPEP_0201521306 /NCGR_PEP_ID=MMETSP0161_2-20130828/14343_1 /ASSEMBLY_ACC=CAM_ASM_000251 /TAXON_ID=180227 /ORGANISM="Neoparamoeba aestuarina, Strain SoJaBio B1-5/56/2" /LENGTH=206 /DNA_ID=CAMNT_0047919921 /DNA_START=90 /DNA_END=710 /DNA_ORIENTATION=-